jgi:rhodanese-related sulfurtransferase
MRDIEHQELVALRAAGAQIVETLGDPEFRAAHIAGAKHLPLRRVLHDARYQLDFDKPVITYCQDAL